MRVLSWNVRGLGAVLKRRAILALLQKHEVEMAFFQETKLVEINVPLVKQVWWSDSFFFDFVPSIGLSGEILVVWDPSKFVAALVTHDPNFLCLRGHWVSDSWESLMIAVYVPCVRSERHDLWERLLAVASAVEIPCCLGGDFNEVMNYAERRGCVGDRGDRFLVLADWLDRFEGLEQRNLLRNVSDHDPVQLSCGVVNWGPRPFRFLNAWLERKGHIKVMGDEWRRISDSHTTSSVVDRLRELKVFLKQWNRESFVCVETQIETTTALLNDLDDRVNELDDENICLRGKVQGDLWRLLRYRESIWRQKSRVLWLREGDRGLGALELWT
ncbi:hypothetical protein V6N13_040097 [Hibiscus sabdariffa]